jgi:hypothetical protein
MAQASIDAGVAPIPSSGLNSTANPYAANDARLWFILEAKVTRVSGNIDLKGFSGLGLGLFSSDARTKGQFAGIPGTTGSLSGVYNAASASTAVATSTVGGDPGLVLPAGAVTLPGTDNQGDRGIFGPYRVSADIGSKNTQAIGLQNWTPDSSIPSAVANMGTIVARLSPDTFTQIDPDSGEPSPYFGRYDFAGLNAWVPLYSVVYNIADTANARTITISPNILGQSPSDSGLRGFRGLNTQEGIDSWMLDNAGFPSIAIQVPGVPAPSTAGAVSVGLWAVCRRRRNGVSAR